MSLELPKPKKQVKNRNDSIIDFLQKDIVLFEKKFGNPQKEAFYSELGLLLSTGVDIKKSLEILLEDIRNKKHQAIIEQIKNDIVNGKSIHEAIQIHKAFTKYEVQSIKIGEESGQLPQVLKELGAYYHASIKLKRQIIGVLTYPSIVISLAFLIIYFMLAVVVPVFSDVFKQTGRQLPELTVMLINLSEKSDTIFYTFFGLGLIGFTIHKTQSKKEWYRKTTSNLLLRIPVVKQLILKIYLARFCQSMKLLIGAKVIISDALELVENMIEFYPMEQALKTVRKEVVIEGKLLNESLEANAIFPKKLVALIKISEEVNAPEVIFEKLHQQYSAELEHQQTVVGKIIEPFFIIFLGLLVSVILIAMYLPMVELSTGGF
ncbi:MAG: type II secretion system F family protein [Bacteroidetes bacterium]|nr:type II secretion system F family protein [Bacteroidota bacterium]MCA6444661.1 type II secretion system F family protein [Bacteroidota bacterium]